ncbi:MAG: hypothetical protein KJP00_15555, partial [Bacteroidia bacterium]|nr:hypothetical protein [Bacteroidia bacterium]
MMKFKIDCRFAWMLIFIFGYFFSHAQEDYAEPKLELSGYVKYLHTATFTDFNPSTLHDNLIHNRIDINWYPKSNWTLKYGMRNRIFWGDTKKDSPLFDEQLEEAGNDYIDVSFNLFQGQKYLGHTTVDRIYLEYDKDKWNIRLGRQRINWGINLIWNPNDLFNAYNFVDFDYEERPGSDALRIQYNYDYASGFEFVVNPDRSGNLWSYAGLWRFNKWNYDFQMLIAKSDRDIAFGGGWAGNLGLWGFKGEFIIADDLDGRHTSYSITTGVDYLFENNLYLNIGYLYNSI